MTDDVRAVAQKILDRTADQIGTHSTNCHEYHLACFAAVVMREMEAATSAPAVDRKQFLEQVNRALFKYDNDPAFGVRQVAEYLSASAPQEVAAPAADREALIQALIRARIDWHGTVTHEPEISWLADAVIAHLGARDVRDVQAEALEQAKARND